MYETETELKVRYVETDRMGIVHHSKYAPYYEVARTDFIASLGKTYRALEEEGIMLPLTELTSNYHDVARYDDELIIKTQLKELTVVRCAFAYRVYLKEDGHLINEGSTTHAFVGSEDFKPLNLKKKYPEIYDLLEQHLTAGDA